MEQTKARRLLATLGVLALWTAGAALGGVRSAQITSTWPSLSVVQNISNSKTSALIVLTGTYPTLTQASDANKFRGIIQLLLTAGPPTGSTQVQAIDALNGPILLMAGSYLSSNNVLFLNQMVRHSNVPLYIFTSTYPTASQAQILRGLRKCTPFIVVTGAYPNATDVINCNAIAGAHLIVNTSGMPNFNDAQNLNGLRAATTVYIADGSFPTVTQAGYLGNISARVNVYRGLAYSPQILAFSVVLQYETNN